MVADLSKARIASTHLKHIMEYAVIRGVSKRQMLAALPYSSDHIYSESAIVTPDEFYTVLQVIDKQLKDDLAGIRCGRFLNMRALGLIYHISLQATSIEEAFYYLKDYLDTTFPILKIDTKISDPFISLFASIDYKNKPGRMNRIIIENMLTIMEREIRMMTGERTDINLFSPCHTPEYPASWSFNDRFGLRFKTVILQASIKDNSRFHLEILIPEYLKLAESLKADSSFSSRVKIAALNLAGPELPDLKTVADSFNITTRTLQRRLQSENNSFRGLIDEMKRRISDMLLQHNRYSVADISFVLGYSEPSAFIHSFKKWHGIPPKKFRESIGY